MNCPYGKICNVKNPDFMVCNFDYLNCMRYFELLNDEIDERMVDEDWES